MGYLAAFVGSVLGSVALGAALGALVLLVPCDSGAFGCLGVAVVALFVAALGAALGAVLGCYLALRLRKHVGAGRTAWTLLGSLVAASVATVLIANTAGIDPAGSMIAIATYVSLPLVARRLALPAKPQLKGGAVDI